MMGQICLTSKAYYDISSEAEYMTTITISALWVEGRGRKGGRETEKHTERFGSTNIIS